MKLLKKSKALEILLALLDGPKHIRELQLHVGGSMTTLEERVKELLRDGLIVEKESKKWPFKRTLELTERGRETAIFLRRIVSFFTGQLSEERQKWILALLYALEEVKGNTRLEKLLFLLKNEFNLDLEPFYEFKPYKLGPFSADILRDAVDLDRAGLIKISEEIYEPHEPSGEWIIGKRYELTFVGKEVAKAIYDKLPSEIKNAFLLLKRFNEMPLKKLIEYVYKKYKHYCQYKPQGD